jgi:hypothetical protein
MEAVLIGKIVTLVGVAIILAMLARKIDESNRDD